MKIPLQFYTDLKKFLEDYKKYLEQIFPRPNYDEPIKDLPMNQDPPKPITPPKVTAGVDLKGHSPAWRGGTLEERKAMYALAKKICLEEKLSANLTRDLLLTIEGESGFNSWCINQQSFDYGIAQFSKKYYLVEYRMTAQEAIDLPAKCLRIMARNFKAGRQSNWVAYKGRMKYVAALNFYV